MAGSQHRTLRSEREEEQETVMQLPPRVARFVRRIARLQPGKYVLTLTVTEERTFWTIQEMGQIEG